MNLLLCTLIGAGIYAYKTNENFKVKADKAYEAIKDLANEGLDEIKKGLEKVKKEEE